MKTTKVHFRYFDHQVKHWIAFFRLNWKVFTGHTEFAHTNLAETICEGPARSATIFLNKNWHETDVTEQELDETAFHEVCEVLLDRLDSMARISCTDEKVNEARHEVIQILTQAIFEPQYQEKYGE